MRVQAPGDSNDGGPARSEAPGGRKIRIQRRECDFDDLVKVHVRGGDWHVVDAGSLASESKISREKVNRTVDESLTRIHRVGVFGDADEPVLLSWTEGGSVVFAGPGDIDVWVFSRAIEEVAGPGDIDVWGFSRAIEEVGADES